MAEIIDAHHHLWRYSEAEFGWITPEMEKLKRDFLAGELLSEMTTAGVDGTLVVQARQSLDETRWLLECAESTAFIRGVVGWVPLLERSIETVLKEFVGAAKLKGVRHVVQAEADGFLVRQDFNAGVASLLGSGLVYELLIHEEQLTEAAKFVRRHPGQKFVLDHLAKPKIRAKDTEPWRTNLMALAEAGDVCCKISGMVTEAEWAAWTIEDLLPYLDAAVEAFGPERLLVGSDWPVCLVASEYAQWWDVMREWVAGFAEHERRALLGATAKRVYGLE